MSEVNEAEVKKVCIALLGSAVKNYKLVKEGTHHMWHLLGKIDAYLNTVRVLAPACGMDKESYGPVLKDLEDKIRQLIQSAKEDEDGGIKIEKSERCIVLTPEGVKRA